MAAPRKPNGRDLVDYREVNDLLMRTESKILQHINGYGTKLTDLDREMSTKFESLETRLRTTENRLSEGKGRASAFGALGGILAGVLTALILRGLTPVAATPTVPGSIRVTMAPAPAASPIVLNLKLSQDPTTGRIVVSPSTITVTPAPEPSQTPSEPPRGPVASLLCMMLPVEPPGLCVHSHSLSEQVLSIPARFIGRVPI